MKKNNDNAIELVIDEFEMNLSEEERIELQKWVHENPENQKLYRELHSLRKGLDILAEYKKLDQDRSWDTLEQKLGYLSDNRINPVIQMRKKQRMWWLSAAAILICTIGITAFLWINATTTLSTLSNQQVQYRLPDGSFITMNGNTVIKFSQNKFDKNRELVLLKGEAFFDVVHDPDKIFQIVMGNLCITDIGTSFIIKRSNSESTVIVQSGKVAFEDLSSGKRFILGPGKKGVFVAGTRNIFAAPNTDINYKSWVDKKLSFNNAPLSEVVKELEETYGSKVILKDDVLKKRMLSATFHYQTIDSALVVIAAGLQLKIDKQTDHYLLTASK